MDEDIISQNTVICPGGTGAPLHPTVNNLDQGQGDMAVMFCTDETENEPDELGDYALCTDMATWLLNATHYAHVEWLHARQEFTMDALSMALGRMRPTDLQLAHFRRLLNDMDTLIEWAQEARKTQGDRADVITAQVLQRKKEREEALAGAKAEAEGK